MQTSLAWNGLTNIFRGERKSIEIIFVHIKQVQLLTCKPMNPAFGWSQHRRARLYLETLIELMSWVDHFQTLDYTQSNGSLENLSSMWDRERNGKTLFFMKYKNPSAKVPLRHATVPCTRSFIMPSPITVLKNTQSEAQEAVNRQKACV